MEAREIEEKSFRIISRYLEKNTLPEEEKRILARVIHASADLRYRDRLVFHPKAAKAGLKAIKAGADIISDVTMVQAGINKKILAAFGGKVRCFLSDPDVAEKAARDKTTKSAAAMRKAARFMDGNIVVVGNAPTALFEVCGLVREGKASPALVIGVPVGFVGAAESKRELLSASVPFITNRGRYGGSSVACAVVNALLIMAKRE